MRHTDFTFLYALAGGVLIGLASLLTVLATGKIPGISGIFSRLLCPRKEDAAWQMVFLLGLIAGAAVSFALVEPAATYRPTRSLIVIGFAGVLVGFGTRLSGGCTSGHGVCGIGLWSKTSLVATALFMAAGITTVFVLRHLGPALAR